MDVAIFHPDYPCASDDLIVDERRPEICQMHLCCRAGQIGCFRWKRTLSRYPHNFVEDRSLNSAVDNGVKAAVMLSCSMPRFYGAVFVLEKSET